MVLWNRSLWMAAFLSLACGQSAAPAPEMLQAPAAGSPKALSAPESKRPAADHPVYSLLDNRLLAHPQRGGGLYLPAGSAGLAKYLRPNAASGWKLRQSADGKPVATASATATLELPLSAEQAKAERIFLRIKPSSAMRLTLKAKGKELGSVALVAGWQTAEIPLTPGILAEGENTLSLSGPGGAVEWLQVGGSPREEALSLGAEGALSLSQGDGLSYYVFIPKGGGLRARLSGEKSCSLRVEAQDGDGGRATGTISGSGAVDLAALAGKVARVSVSLDGCARASLEEAALTAPGAAPSASPVKPPKHVILWVMDSLRADRIHAINPSTRNETPVFDRIAKEGTVFANASVQGNESRASHASLWTSLYPVHHRMINGSAKIDPKWTTLDEVMKDAGFYASGVSSNGYITAKWGFGARWDAYRNHIHDGGGVKGEDVYKKAIASIEKKLDKPTFLYLGTIDTHVSWRAKEPWMSRYDPKPYAGRFEKVASGNDMGAVATGKLKISERDKEHIVAIYDSNVSYQDELLGKLLDQLKAWGVDQETMVIVTADHGDEQWEDGRVGHGASLRDSLIHVPLAIYYPPLAAGGVIDEGADAGIDVIPTVLDALGKSIPAEMQGESLLPLIQGVGRGYPRPALSTQYEESHAMRLGGWKMFVPAAASPRLYDTSADPNERKDLANDRPLEKRALADSLYTFLAYRKEWRKSTWGVPSNQKPGAALALEGKK